MGVDRELLVPRNRGPVRAVLPVTPLRVTRKPDLAAITKANGLNPAQRVRPLIITARVDIADLGVGNVDCVTVGIATVQGNVSSRSANENIVSGSANENIDATGSNERIVAITTPERVCTLVAVKRVSSGSPVNVRTGKCCRGNRDHTLHRPGHRDLALLREAQRHVVSNTSPVRRPGRHRKACPLNRLAQRQLVNVIPRRGLHHGREGCIDNVDQALPHVSQVVTGLGRVRCRLPIHTHRVAVTSLNRPKQPHQLNARTTHVERLQ